MEVYGCTDVGREREHNEDALLFLDGDLGMLTAFESVEVISAPDGPALFMVADGMGGAAAGEIASSMAVDSVARSIGEQWRAATAGDAGAAAHLLSAATDSANRAIHAYAEANPEHYGMGTTATIAVLHGSSLFLSQVGDSRAYLIRTGKARQITRDQSLTQRLVEAGELTREEAELSDRRNIILQALGPEPEILSDISVQSLCRGDVLLLCSDGLSGVVREPDLERAFATTPDLKQACDGLIELANDRGGPDNITVLAARFSGESLEAPGAADSVGYLSFFASQDGSERAGTGPRGVAPEAASPLRDDSPRSTASAAAGQRVVAGGSDEEEMSPVLVYAVLAAACLGVATILLRRML